MLSLSAFKFKWNKEGSNMKDESKLKNIKSISRSLQWFLAFCLLAGAFSVAMAVTMAIIGKVDYFLEGMGTIWLSLIVDSVDIVALFFIYKVLKNFRQGLLFLSDNVRWLKTAVYLKFTNWVLLLWHNVSNHVAGKKSELGNVDLVLLLLMLLFAYILEEACSVYEEGKLTI